MAKLVSMVYGEALYRAAMESGEAKTVALMEEIRSVTKILEENPQFDALMKHPGIPKQEKLQVIENVFKGRVSNELAGLLAVVVAKERYSELPAVFAYVTHKVKEQQKIGVAYVTTAITLSAKQKKAVKKRLLETAGYRTVELHFGVEPLIIGGMIIRINNRVVDSSIRTKLAGLEKQLLNIQLG